MMAGLSFVCLRSFTAFMKKHPCAWASMSSMTMLRPVGVRSVVSVPISPGASLSRMCVKMPAAYWKDLHALLMPSSLFQSEADPYRDSRAC